MRRRRFAACVLGFIVAAAFAQESERKQVVAVSVDSRDPRIQIMQGLREEAAKVVEQSAKNVRSVIVIGSSSAVEADYLLTIKLSLQPQVSIPSKDAPENRPTTTADVPIGGVPLGIAHARCPDLLQESFTFSYTVISLRGKNVNLHYSHTISEAEFPLGPELACLPEMASQAVRVCASAAVKKLKSKKAI